MTLLQRHPRTIVARLRALALMAAAAVLLAGCETTGTPAVEAAKPPEPPMTHSRAAQECWMKTEKGSASLDLDKRADIVNKCIDEKMKTASGTAEPAAPAPNAKKKKPATAAAAEKKQPATPAAGAPDKKPAAADAGDKKP